MKEIIFYIVVFILTYLFYLIFVLNRKNVLKKFPNGKEMTYLKYKYNVKVNEKNLKSIANTVFLANSFILATTVFVVSLIDSLIIEIIIGLFTLLLLILLIYHIIGTYYKKKQGGNKNV